MLLFGIFVPEETAAAVSKPGWWRSISNFVEGSKLLLVSGIVIARKE